MAVTSEIEPTESDHLGRRQRFRELLRDGPLDPDYWLGEVDARWVGIFRAGLGAILFCDTLLALPHVTALYGKGGVWPSRLATGPLAGASDAVLFVVWALGAAALLSFALGLFARLSAALSWLFLMAIHQRNGGVTTGADYLAQIILFLCIGLDTGSAFSLSARWFGRGREFVAAAPFRAIQAHVAILYFVTARLKVRGGWLSGDGIYLSLQHLGFVRPPGAFLLQHPELCRVSTYVVLALEGAFAFLALSPIKNRQTRVGALVCGLAVQLGILITMRVGMFTTLMLWLSLLYVPAAARPAPTEKRAFQYRVALSLASLVVVLLICWGAFVGRRFPLPRVINAGLQRTGLVQPYDLFGATYEVAQWSASGVTPHGHVVDLLTTVAPGFRSVVGWSFSPFYKLTFATDADHAAIAKWLCRQAEQLGVPPLAQVTLSMRAHQPNRPQEVPRTRDVILYAGSCDARAQ